MPTQPPTHKANTLPVHQATRDVPKHQRLLWTARYRRFRLWVLSQRPLCEEPGCRRTGLDIHHVRGLLWHPEDLCNQDMAQVLCHSCHARKVDMPTPYPNRFVVTGLPGAGKTTWVRERAKPGDVVWDIDDVAAAVFGLPTYPRPDDVATYLAAMRAALLRSIATTDRAVYVVAWESDKAEALAAQIGGTVVHVHCPEEERLRRIKLRHAREG